MALLGSAAAQLCERWGEAVTLGELDVSLLPEASGIAASSRFPGRLYHVNDSGDGPFVYLTDLQGANTERLRIAGVGQPEDVEDLALGPCGGATCLFVADIGDNRLSRDTLEVFVIEEREAYGASAPLRGRVTLVYPDGPHDAEGFAVHPTGDFFLLTKARLSQWQARPARLYTLPRARWEAAGAGERLLLDFVTEIDLRALSGVPIDVLSHIATALDISPDGERLLVLTYGNAYEISLASLLAGGELEPGRDYRPVPLRRLPQQESAAYLPGARSFVYSSEARTGTAELVRLDCLDAPPALD